MNIQAKITEFDNVRIIAWPAFTYIERTDDEAICVDQGGEHLGEPTPGISIPFPTQRYGDQHRNFGICEDENGFPLAYGKGATITSEKSAHRTLAAARIGGKILYKGKTYIVSEASNKNIEFEAV